MAAHQINKEIIMSAILIFISFSLMASSVYILNDLIDIKADRAHPLKRYRAFASKNSDKLRQILAVLLLILSLIID